MRLTLILTGTCAFFLFVAGAMAQMPPTQSSMKVATPPMAASVPTAVTPNLTAPPVGDDYIWFGNDQINEASRLIRQHREVEALQILDDVIQLNIRLSEAHLLTGLAWLQLKDLAKAEQAFNTVLAVDRGYLGAYVYLSKIALLRNNMQQATVYLQAIKAICRTDDCAEYRYVQNSMRSVAPPPEKQ